ncbi:MAG: mechanosensitive ion channel, partial [Nanoarchaeota archaeon]|nr:mechanosensitive ion channel [Nanoarchaeota archaeon]
ILSYVFIILSAAVLFSISISIFLTLRDFLPNVIAGFYLFRRFEPGTKVRIGNSSGEIIRMDLFSIILKTEDEDMLYVPNSLATKSVLIVQAKK